MIFVLHSSLFFLILCQLYSKWSLFWNFCAGDCRVCKTHIKGQNIIDCRQRSPAFRWFDFRSSLPFETTGNQTTKTVTALTFLSVKSKTSPQKVLKAEIHLPGPPFGQAFGQTSPAQENSHAAGRLTNGRGHLREFDPCASQRTGNSYILTAAAMPAADSLFYEMEF